MATPLHLWVMRLTSHFFTTDKLDFEYQRPNVTDFALDTIIYKLTGVTTFEDTTLVGYEHYITTYRSTDVNVSNTEKDAL